MTGRCQQAVSALAASAGRGCAPAAQRAPGWITKKIMRIVEDARGFVARQSRQYLLVYYSTLQRRKCNRFERCSNLSLVRYRSISSYFTLICALLQSSNSALSVRYLPCASLFQQCPSLRPHPVVFRSDFWASNLAVYAETTTRAVSAATPGRHVPPCHQVYHS